MRIAMVCSGNVCRSPMAQTVLRAKLARAGIADVAVDSFGTGPWHAGEPMQRRAEDALRAAGYRPGEHVARMIEAADLPEHDLVVAMAREHERALRRLAVGLGGGPRHPPPIRLLSSYVADWSGADGDVPDPYYGGAADYAEALRLIERGTDAMLAELSSAGRRP